MSLPPWGGTHSWTTETATETLLDRIETNTDHLKRRLDTIEQLIDSATAAQGQLLVTNGAATVARTSSRGQAGPIGVALASMTPSGIVQYVRWAGIAEVMIASAVAIGDRLRPSATVGRAETCPNGSPGAFAVARTAGATTGDIIEVVLTPGGRQNWRYAAAVAAAATFTVPVDGEIVAVTGTTTITSFVGGGQERAIILDAVDGFTIDAAALANTSADVVLAADRSVLLFTNGTGWFLVGAPPTVAAPGVAPQVVPPHAASWTLVNPITGPFSTTHLADGLDGVVHLLASGSTGTNAQLAVITQPATPYTIKARLRLNLRGLSNKIAGLCFYSTGDGKVTAIGIQNTTAPTLLSEAQYSSVTVYVTQAATEGASQASVRDIWFKLANDGSTHRTYAYSYDGNDDSWVVLSDVGPTHYHTPNRVGVFADPQSVNTDLQVTLVSWEVS